MKRSLVLLIAVFAASVAVAQEQERVAYFSPASRYLTVDLAKVQRAYLYTLESENNGVVESGIAQILRMKLVLPALACPRIKEKLDELAVEGRTRSIRYKAYLTGLVFDDPQGFSLAGLDEYTPPEEMFASMAFQIQQVAFNNGSR